MARQLNQAFMKAMKPSPALAAIVGSSELPRTEAVKKMWDYIKKHNLQDPQNKRNIRADDRLKPLFGKEIISMFELAKIISQHLS